MILSGLETVLRLSWCRLDVVELGKDHAIFDVFRLQAYDLFEFGNGLVEDAA